MGWWIHRWKSKREVLVQYHHGQLGSRISTVVGSAAGSTRSRGSSVMFDTCPWLLADGGDVSRHQIVSGARRVSRREQEIILSNDIDKDDVTILPMEIDNHADMTCAGRNCGIEPYNTYECTVSSFLDEYQEQQHIKICTALTTATTPSMGEIVILRLGQCLAFHEKLHKTLINANQLWAFSISICDDPTDKHWQQLGIQLDRNTYLSLYMEGLICGVMTWSSPTSNEELESCHIFDISNMHNWEPSSVIFISGR